jgi:hypothetical protein
MLKKQIFVLIFILFILTLFACGGTTQATPMVIPVVVTVEVPSEEPSQATPVFIPVVVTVEVSVTVMIPAPTVTPLATIEPTPVLSNSQNLEEDVSLWKVYLEGTPTPEIENVDIPSIEGKSLRCSITGGSPYSNVHCYRNLASEPDANSFALSLDFQFTPPTTCNNQESYVKFCVKV